MAELHDALKYLGPVDWSDVPQDNLEPYLGDRFTAAELICNSLPPPPNGTPFGDAKPHHRSPNSAKSHKDLHPSSVLPHPRHPEHEALQKNWGKPIKFKPQDNPLQVSVYKMAGHDRHGAWFARKSIHEGIGFDKFKRAMMREFPESLTVSGGPGAGAVRGLSADRRLERIDVKGVGKLEVYQLSAQFPGPVTPRDFMTMLMSSDEVLTDKSAAELDGGKKHVPRHLMLLSNPVEHPEGPLRSGYVRGQYESVEMIREIPLSTAESKSTPNLLAHTEPKTRERGHTASTADLVTEDASGTSDDPELNPVEWTMITRSDPGGGIPRFLVERGTPETMISDVHKFFNWACALDHIPGPDDDLENQEEASEQEPGTNERRESNHLPHNSNPQHDGSTDTQTREAGQALSAEQPNEQGGIMTNLTKAIEAGIDTYAPTSVSNMVHRNLGTPQPDFSDDSSDTSSVDSFLSAEEMRRISTSQESPQGKPGDSAETLSVASADVAVTPNDQRSLGHHEKEVLKLTRKREKLEQQLAKKRVSEENKLKQSQEKEESETTKQKEEMEKKLRKTEEKHRKEVEKLEAKKAKEARKAEEKRKKKDEQTKLSLVSRERDEFRSQSDLYRRENTLLREQVADLQAQNNLLAQKLAKVGGQDALKSLEEEFAHSRNKSKSSRSNRSTASSDSVPKSLGKQAEEVHVGAS